MQEGQINRQRYLDPILLQKDNNGYCKIDELGSDIRLDVSLK